MNPTSALFGFAILAATFLGPIFAVLITRYFDKKRDMRSRKTDVFRSLMATRQAIVTVDHVNALNLIEIEFYDSKVVMDAWRKYFGSLGISPATDKVINDRKELLTKLLYEMGKILGYNIEQLEILSGGYIPQGFVDIERQKNEIRMLFSDIYNNKRDFPINIKNSSEKNESK